MDIFILFGIPIIILLLIVLRNWCLKKDNEKFIFFDEIIKAVQDDAFILSVFCIGIILNIINNDIEYKTLCLYIILNLFIFIDYKIFFEIELNKPFDDKDKKIRSFFLRFNIIILFCLGIVGIPTTVPEMIKSLIDCFHIKCFKDLTVVARIIFLYCPSIFFAYKIIILISNICTISNKELNNRTDELEKRVKILEERVEVLEKNNNKK